MKLNLIKTEDIPAILRIAGIAVVVGVSFGVSQELAMDREINGAYVVAYPVILGMLWSIFNKPIFRWLTFGQFKREPVDVSDKDRRDFKKGERMFLHFLTLSVGCLALHLVWLWDDSLKQIEKHFYEVHGISINKDMQEGDNICLDDRNEEIRL